MPFKSEKQRKYLWANEPGIARDWTDKYGSRVKKANGGIGDLIQKYNPFTGVGAGLYGHFQNLGDIKANAPNQRDYNIEATRDLWSNLSNNIQNPVTRGIMDVTSPALSLVTSPIYDAMQAGIRTVYDTNTGEFRGPLDNFDITNTMNPDYKGNTTPGFFTRLDQENPISSAWERYLGASKHLSEKYPNASNSLAKAWNAIKNEFGGSAEAATLGNLIRPRSQASQAPQIRDRWNIKYGTDETLAKYGDQGWVGGPLKEYDPKLDLNKAYRLGMNEYLKRNKPISYSETDIIPSEHPYANMIKTIPYKGSRFSIKDIKNIGLNQDEDDPYLNRIRNRINTVSQPRGIMASLRNRFYKPATSAAGGYNVSQLNQMNALGGYYSEPARAQRRNQARVNNMMARKAAGKSYSKTNLANLSGGDTSTSGDYHSGHQSTVDGQTTDWGPNSAMIARGGLAQYAPRGSYFNGGLASLWPR